MPWLVAPMVTAASPVRTPARASMPGPSDRTASTRSSAGADGPLGVVLLGRGRAPDGHDRVADELLDGAAVAGDDVRGDVEVAREGVAHVLRVALLRERREPDEVGEQDGHEAPLRDGAGYVWPRSSHTRSGRRPRSWPVRPGASAHSPQNRASGLFGVPHAGQASASRAAHALQNLRPASFSVPQLEHVTARA